MARLNLGFYGLGQAAGTLTLELRKKWPDMEIVAYDKYVNETVLGRVDKAKVEFVPTVKEFSEKVKVVYSLVTPSAALTAAREIGSTLRPGCVYVDFNSVSPKVKKRIEAELEKLEISVVDAAVMGSVVTNGLKVPILLAGKDAISLSERMNSLGFKTRIVSERVGEAAAIKMVRSVFTKGLEALFIEMLLAAGRYGVQKQVVDSIAQSLENRPIKKVMNTFVVSQALHSARKKTEMENVMETLKDVNLKPIMSEATKDVFAFVTSLNLQLKTESIDYHTVVDTIEKVINTTL